MLGSHHREETMQRKHAMQHRAGSVFASFLFAISVGIFFPACDSTETGGTAKGGAMSGGTTSTGGQTPTSLAEPFLLAASPSLAASYPPVVSLPLQAGEAEGQPAAAQLAAAAAQPSTAARLLPAV